MRFQKKKKATTWWNEKLRHKQDGSYAKQHRQWILLIVTFVITVFSLWLSKLQAAKANGCKVTSDLSSIQSCYSVRTVKTDSRSTVYFLSLCKRSSRAVNAVYAWATLNKQVSVELQWMDHKLQKKNRLCNRRAPQLQVGHYDSMAAVEWHCLGFIQTRVPTLWSRGGKYWSTNTLLLHFRDFSQVYVLYLSLYFTANFLLFSLNFVISAKSSSKVVFHLWQNNIFTFYFYLSKGVESMFIYFYFFTQVFRLFQNV